MDYTTADYRPDDPTWRASHGYPPLAQGQTGFETSPALGAPDAIPPPIGGANAPVVGAGNTAPYIINPQTGLPYGGSGTTSGTFTDNMGTYSQGAINPDAYYRPNPRTLGPTEMEDYNRGPGQLMTYQGNRTVPYNPNVKPPIVHQNVSWTPEVAQAFEVPLGAMTLAGGLGGADFGGGYPGPEELGTGFPVPAEAGGYAGIDPSTGLTSAAPGIGGDAPVTDFFNNTGVDEFGNPTQSNFQGGPGTPGSSDFFNPSGTPGGLPAAPPNTTSVPPGTQSALEKVFGKGIMAAIGNNPAVAAALAAGVMEKSNNPLTQPTIDAIRGAISSGQSIQGMQIPGITQSLQRAIDTANTNVGAWKPALDEAGAFTRSGGAPITAADTARYMNPYIDQALAPAARKISEAAAAQRMSDAAKAGSRGAFGTERNDQIAALGNRNELMATGDLYGTGYANAFNTALTTAGADKSRALTAGGAFGNIATNTSALGGKDVEGLTSAGGIESLPFTEELTKQKTAGDVLSGAGNAGARAIGSTGQPSLLTNLTGAAGVLGAFDKLGNPSTTTPSTPSIPSLPSVGTLPSFANTSPVSSPSTPSAPTSNNPFDDSNSGVFGS